MTKRVVVIGAYGFVGSSIVRALKSKFFRLVKISKDDINLLKDNSIKKLNNLIEDGDTVVFVSAIAPCKDLEQFSQNFLLVKNFISAVSNKKISHIINISSDAVYSDSEKKINENSKTYPDSIHGSMHLMRETLLQSFFGNIISIIRPTLIYGENDPHNGYGPNKFFRLAKEKKDITLFGKGEELRDHIFIDDVGILVSKIIENQSYGIFNAVSGQVMSFYEIANSIIKKYDSQIKIHTTIRHGNMPHNGYRAFEISKAEKLFIDFKFISIKDGINKF